MTATRSTLPAWLALLALVLLGGELLVITFGFNAAGLLRNENLSVWQLPFAYMGQLSRILLVIVFIFIYARRAQLVEHWRAFIRQFRLGRYGLYIFLQVVCFAGMLYFTARVFGQPQGVVETSIVVYLLWLVFALSTGVTWLFCLFGVDYIRSFMRMEWRSIGFSVLCGVGFWGLAQGTQQLWSSYVSELMVGASFALASVLLGTLSGQAIIADPENKYLGVEDFLVHIAPECSGYEGIGLVLAFAALYIYLSRDRLIFPRVYLLLPIGAFVIWFLNSVRIALLVLIGYYWSPKVALEGFHSQAGWITFIFTSLGLLWVTDKTRFFNRFPDHDKGSSKTINLPIATLLPLVALLAVTLITAAFIGDFDYLYPLRVLVALAVIAIVWKHLDLQPYRPRWEALLAAAFVAVLWIFILGSDPEASASFQAGIDSMPTFWGGLWLCFRFFGTILTVPIAEELAFRGYLLCKLSRVDVCTRGSLPVVIVAVALSSLAFGLLHGAWAAGTIAGIIYAWVRLKTSHIGDAILAHAGTNAILVVYAVVTGEWSLL